MTSGFGKVILLGEHAVVYGQPALAGAVDLRVAARVAPARVSSLTVPAWRLAVGESDDGAVGEALRSLVEASCPGEHWRIAATSTLPPGAGLGSSAALSVAIARALALSHGERPTAAEIETRAGAGERCFHRKPSGVDVAVAARGGLGLFRRGDGFAPIEAAPIQIVVGLTGEPRRTSAMIDVVAAAREVDPSQTGARLERLGALAVEGARAAAGGDTAELAARFREAQSILATLGVSSPGIEEMIAVAEEAGALGAKLTGAGGGGAVIALAPGKEEAIARAWRAAGKEAFVTAVGAGAGAGAGGVS
jgi:mevalonate kinase